ncbi:hypothetical protein E4U30_000812 [Claviceps sp. LM220 group G6]|nr:hypothetical protein E4U15_003649 [Claviceps sp. LM218 group G6]KAG6097288.1 hypothetical protein E4U30_000812 [Claviceps sp. LM220 group G6]KAG6105776.1 hypothetical protein E4U31_001214 [Claviceps sp. LM219 group G6]KAG6107230.1 hypothetical protein E4U14_004267 [Claviceps sp. LM454 group G7]
MYYECGICDRAFATPRGRTQHANSTGHHPQYDCDYCDDEFYDSNEEWAHKQTYGHWSPNIKCETCSLLFRSDAEANRHMQQHGHYKNYCKPCDRHFENENNLRQHLNSRVHRGQNMQCPFCKTGFTTASGVSHHLETGSCPRAPSLNRETLLRAIRERDPGGLITNKMIGWRDEQVGQYEATSRAWNGMSWECYLCHSGFSSKVGLNQHLNSPRHKDKVYKCPNKRGGCEKVFVSLAALFSHLESESCSFMRFEQVQQQATRILDSGRMISN